MARVLVTGMSGTGKSTLLDELAQRGHLTVDTDDDGWEQPPGRWKEVRMAELLAHEPDVIVSGTVENQGRFYDRFEFVILLTAPVEVLIARVAKRTNNPYGNSLQDQAEIRRYVDEVEPLLRGGATHELDGCRPTSELADAIESLLSGAGLQTSTRSVPAAAGSADTRPWSPLRSDEASREASSSANFDACGRR